MNNKFMCGCVVCKQEMPSSNLRYHDYHSHQYIFPKVPRNFGKCHGCDKILRGYVRNKFCSQSCAALFNNKKRTTESRKKQGAAASKTMTGRPSLLPKFSQVEQCVVCNKWFKGRDLKTCSNSCLTIRQQEYGKKSAAVQKRRSKDEIALFELCKSKFTSVRHNEIIIDGWDADIIIDDIKTAILWNGPWHYTEMKGLKHSLLQVQTRDKIKIDLLTKNGWTVKIFEDRNYTPLTAYQEITM